MNLKDFEGGNPQNIFEDAIFNLSEGTQKLYRRCFNEFCNWIESTPEELYEQALEYEKTEPRTLSRAVSRFMSELIEEGKHPNTVRSYKKAINKFLQVNGLRPVKIDNEKKIDYKGMSIIKPDQIRELATYTKKNLRLRALIMILKDSGLRVSDIVHLTVEDWWNNTRRFGPRREYKAWCEPFTTKKNGVNAYIRLGPESVEWVEKYIGNRREGPIFVKNDGKPYPPHTISTLINHLCKPLRKRGLKISAHSFRKFFMSSFASNGYLEAGKRIAGKRLGATDEPYIDFESSLDDIYVEVYTSERTPLSIYESSQREKVQDLESEVEKLRVLSTDQGNELLELKEWQDRTSAWLLETIRHQVNNSPDPEKEKARLLDGLEKSEAEYYGTPFNEIEDLSLLTPEQRESYLDVKALRDFQEITKNLDPNKKYSVYVKEVKDQ